MAAGQQVIGSPGLKNFRMDVMIYRRPTKATSVCAFFAVA